ncbi:Snf7 [Musa troglodytarum]|uniref:Snf7 n=1 Tax=Musa troglodytarum TaxID=320322 RepID=A0A9E7K4J2_9LILI|nr:Snf7 [Musa troglodytarum]
MNIFKKKTSPKERKEFVIRIPFPFKFFLISLEYMIQRFSWSKFATYGFVSFYFSFVIPFIGYFEPSSLNLIVVLHRADALRTSKREMAVATRGVEREIASLQLEEKKLVAEIKKTAQTGNEAATRILARQLVRLRQQITNLQGARAQIRGIATHTQATYASTSISTGMKGASKAMAAMNKQMEPAKQLKVMKEFQKQSSQMDMTIEMMSEAIDETLDKDEAEEETEELTNQVLDEIGVDVASQLSSAPKGRIAVNNKKVDTASRNVAPENSEVDDLEKRLASLRRI